MTDRPTLVSNLYINFRTTPEARTFRCNKSSGKTSELGKKKKEKKRARDLLMRERLTTLTYSRFKIICIVHCAAEARVCACTCEFFFSFISSARGVCFRTRVWTSGGMDVFTRDIASFFSLSLCMRVCLRKRRQGEECRESHVRWFLRVKILFSHLLGTRDL